MTHYRNIAVACVIALVIAACASSQQTEIRNDVASGCIESRAVYNGHRLYCQAEKASPVCSVANAEKAVAIQGEARKFCAGNPPNTPANIARIQALVDQQRAVGRVK